MQFKRENKFLTIEQAAHAVQIKVWRFRRICDLAKIKGIKVGNTLLFAHETVSRIRKFAEPG
jgi:hypothetical protein